MLKKFVHFSTCIYITYCISLYSK